MSGVVRPAQVRRLVALIRGQDDAHALDDAAELSAGLKTTWGVLAENLLAAARRNSTAAEYQAALKEAR